MPSSQEMRGPPSGRAQGRQRQPFDEVSGSHGAFTSDFRGSEFYFNLRNLMDNGTCEIKRLAAVDQSIVDREGVDSSL
jgi:hypothetical protein